MVSAPSKFASIPVRPPTPPKDAHEHLDSEINDAFALLDDPFGTKQFLATEPAGPTPPATAAASSTAAIAATSPQTLLSTPLSSPDQSPSSETGHSSVTSSTKKRVNFELQLCDKPKQIGLLASPWAPRHSSPLRPLPETRLTRPLKSILKPSDPTSIPSSPVDGAAPLNFDNLAEMLESVVKMLAQDARPSKIDAYLQLERTLAAYKKVPDTEALINKMGLFTHFIRRDLQAKGISGSGPDTQLVQYTLKFLMALLRIPELKPAMDDDFCTFMVDRSIDIGGGSTNVKLIVNAHLAFLMQQNIGPEVMTRARVERILDFLDTIHTRVSGHSVQVYRVRIYRKLIQQKPDVMAKHTERWFKFVLKAMLSSQKDTHSSALDTAVSAAKSIGSDPHVTKSVLNLLNRVKQDGDTWGKAFAQELGKQLDTETAVLVPQIWATVTSFLGGAMQQENEKYENYFLAKKEWLKVLEKLYSQDVNEAVKPYANIAHTFLIYAVDLNENTPARWSNIVCQMSHQQLALRGQVRKLEVDSITSAYLTLLYYAFRPLASNAQIDRYWLEFVAEFWTPLLHDSPSSTKNAFAACRMVSALLLGSRKPWDQHRALELKLTAMVQRAELPLLDPKWVRRSLATVLQFIETLLDVTPWASETVEDEPVKALWLSLLNSLVEAGSKEVMATSETKDAVAHIVNMLRRMWDRHTAKLALSQENEDSWADKFCFLIESVVEKLGALQFADKCLARNGQDLFEVAPTPRSLKHGPRVSPLLYFVDLLVSRSEGKLPDPVRLRVMGLILGPCLDAQNTRLNKLELLRDCSATVNASSANLVASSFWERVGALTKSCLEEHPSDSNERSSRQLGKEYEAVVEILTLGSSYLLNAQCGQDLLSTFAETVRREAGEGAVVLAVIEKVSGSVLMPVCKNDRGACLPYISILLSNVRSTIARRTLEQGAKNLYTSSPAPTRTHQDFEPYNHLHSAVTLVGSAAYKNLDLAKVETTRRFITALTNSIRQCPVSLMAVYLRKMQSCISIWVEDSDGRMQNTDPLIKQLHKEVVNLWQAVIAAIEKLPQRDSTILFTLENLFTAGFKSRRRDIVNISVTFWNSTFGRQEKLDYPAQLKQALLRLRDIVDLSLPSLDGYKNESGDPPSFYESDSSAGDATKEEKSSRNRESPFRLGRSARKTQSPAVSSPGSRRASARSTPKLRLRHDDSQLVFEPIASSPTNPLNQESQVLTERQKEVIERQSNGRFASPKKSRLAATSTDGLPEAQSGVDDLHTKNSRTTPLKALAAMGPMDVFLGSSPTPQARNRSQQVMSDATSLATPNAVRTMHVANGLDELGSSPPRFEKSTKSAVDGAASNEPRDATVDSFDSSYSHSVDEGTTLDEGLLPVSDVLGQSTQVEDELPNELSSINVPSSTVEVQLNAQLDADMEARNGASGVSKTPVKGPPSKSPKVPRSKSDHQKTAQQLVQDGASASKRHDAVSNNTDGVSDSQEIPAGSRSQTPEVRRSARKSGVPSPAVQIEPKKRKKSLSSSGTKPKRQKTDDDQEDELQQETVTQESQVEEVEEGDEPMRERVVLAPPSSKPKNKRKRSKSNSQASPKAAVVESIKKRAFVPSSLSQMENLSDDELVADTPPSKRFRKGVDRDVSEAKATTPVQSQAKVLSHVLVTPRRHSFTSQESSGAVDAMDETVIDTPAQFNHAPSGGDQKAKAKAAQESQGDTAAPPRADPSQPPQTATGTETPKRSFAERVKLTPRSIIDRFQKMLSDVKEMVFSREDERAMDDVLFELRREVHAAGRRAEDPDDLQQQ